MHSTQSTFSTIQQATNRLRRWVCTGLLLAGPLASSTSAATAERPNILFLLGDDVTSRDLGCYGGKLAKTPVIDGLAHQGTLFENSFVTTAICGPSRACILAGQHQRTTGIKDFETPFTNEAFDQTYPMLMKKDGYRVGFIGKWGVGAKPDKMKYPASRFDYWRGVHAQSGYWYDDNGLIWKDAYTYTKPAGNNVRHEADQFPIYLREFLDGAKTGQPWCFSVSFKSVHPPRAPYPTLLNRFRGPELPPLPSSFSQKAFDGLPEHLKTTFSAFSRQRNQTFMDCWKEHGFQEDYGQYLRSIETLDMTVGRLLDILKEKGVDRNTVIIFFGDNGNQNGEKGLVGKWLMYEPSIRVPTVFFDPRHAEPSAGQRLKPMVLSIDLAPTMLELAGIQKPSAMQGESWLPLLKNPTTPWRTDWFYEHTYIPPKPDVIAKSEGVRTERFKYIRWIDPKPHVEELFDLQTDPEELHNLAKDPASQQMLGKLRARYQYWRKTLPDNAPDADEYEGNPLETKPQGL